MLLYILLVVFGLGAFWVYVVPIIQAQIPATLVQNKLAQIAMVGALLFVTVFIVSKVVKAVDGKKAI